MQGHRHFLLMPIPQIFFVCSSCGGRLYGNPHPIAKYLHIALWLTLCALLYGVFSQASIFFIGASGILFLVFAAIYWYVGAYILRHWPTFRSEPQR